MLRLALPVLSLALLSSAILLPRPDAAESLAESEEARWYRGNTHTHTLWSDGDGAPELVVDLYREAQYDFLVLTDHNLLSEGERWFPVFQDGDVEKRLTPERVEALRGRFGGDSVEVRRTETRQEMRLHTLAELRERFEEPGEFLLIQGEEVTGGFERRPIHVNALNVSEAVYPPKGESVAATLNAILEAIAEHGRDAGRPVLAHVNHPNFGWGITWQELASIAADRFFEVYNGHPAVRLDGDGEHVSMEQMWDRALHLRLSELDLGLMYGLATDDSHHYHDIAVGRSNSLRGWIQVRAESLTAEGVLAAMRRGDFYSSSGVELVDVVADEARLELQVRREPGVSYTVRFVGTLRGAAADEVGRVLAEVELAGEEDRASYTFTGEELYVRAVVESDRPHPNPYAEGDVEMAWVQPALPGKR